MPDFLLDTSWYVSKLTKITKAKNKTKKKKNPKKQKKHPSLSLLAKRLHFSRAK
jgi:hypothetical protein